MSKNLVNLVRREARRLTHTSETGRWRLRELEDALQEAGVERQLKAQREPMKTLLKEGHVTRFRAATRTKYTSSVHRISLANLLYRAADKVGPNDGNVGARSKRGPRTVETITESNLTNMRAMATKVAEYLNPQRDRAEVLSEIQGDYFVWDEEEHEWSSFLSLVRKAVRAADLGTNTRNRYVGAARKLLDLAATHHWIPRSPPHEDGYEPIPAAWADTFNSWRSELVGEGINRPHMGPMLLLEACARLDENPEDVNWEHVIQHLEEWFRAADTPHGQRSSVRRSYEKLREKGIVSGPGWNGRRRQRKTAVILLPRSAITWVSKRYGNGPDGDRRGIKAAIQGESFPWKGWEQYEDGLVSGPYGLRRAVLYFTTSGGDARLLDLPARGTFPRVSIRNMRPERQKAWRVATLSGHLRRTLHVAGWMEDELEVDWSQSDLRDLLNFDRLDAYLQQVYACDDLTTLREAKRRARLLARIASPYLEAVALDEGNEELADRLQYVSKKLSSHVAVDGEPSWLVTLRKDVEDRDAIDSQRKKAKRIEKVWTRKQSASDYAYRQLRSLLRHHLSALENRYGKLPDQVSAIRQGHGGTEPFDREWAQNVLDVLYLHDQLVVPLRVSTSRWLDVDDRKHTPDFEHIYAEIDADKMKESQNGDFNPNYTAGGSGYRQNLYRLYVMKGGARELLRTTATGRLEDVEAFYVPDVEDSSDDRVGNSSFRTLVKRLIREGEPALNGVTLKELEDSNVLGTHFFRHAFGTFMARNGRLEVAALYLHHADLEMLRKVYSANSEDDYDVAEYLQEDLKELNE